MTKSLRDYQQEAYDAVRQTLFETEDNGVVVCPTGGGKTVIFATLIRDFLQAWPSTRICVLAHRKELLCQAEDKILNVWPDAPTGIYSAGLRRREMNTPILIAGINSIWKKAYDLDPFDLIVIDEAHLVPADDETMYGKFLADCWRANPRVRFVGFTATPFRLDGGLIYGDGKMFSTLIYQADVKRLIDGGYLSPVRTKAPESQIDTDGVHVRRGDFVESELERAALDCVRPAVQEMVSLASSRSSWLVFACGVKHAEQVTEALHRDHGINAEIIVGGTADAKRDRILRDFDAGRVRVVVNVGCLTTGLDVTRIDCIACLRPTKSTSLWIQMVGRGMRLHPGKSDCLLLDFGGNIRRHGPIDNPKVPEPGAGGGVAPTKTCPECFEVVAAGVLQCYSCGHTFPEREIKHETTAETMPALSHEHWIEQVTQVTCRVHHKEGGTPSLRVDYRCGFHVYSEWVCFGHSGFAREKACRWWKKRTGQSKTPISAADALLLLSRINLSEITESVRIKRNGKFEEIIDVKFREEHLNGSDA